MAEIVWRNIFDPEIRCDGAGPVKCISIVPGSYRVGNGSWHSVLDINIRRHVERTAVTVGIIEPQVVGGMCYGL